MTDGSQTPDLPEIPSPFYRVSVKALVFDEHRRLLVAREPDGFWEIPGGGWEHGETFEECLARELHEEIGGELRAVDLTTLYPCEGPGRHYRRIKLTVRAELGDGELTPGEEITEIRWVTREEFTTLEMRNGDEAMRDHVDASWPPD